jgi:hypothetical protein
MPGGWRPTRKTVFVCVARFIDAAVTGSAPLINIAALSRPMPATKEIKCTSDDCELDLFENHYTYDVADDHSVVDLSCPLCGGTDCLEAIEL